MEQRRWHREAEHLRGPQVDNQLEIRRRLDRKLARPGTPKGDAAVPSERRAPALGASSFGCRRIATLLTSGAISFSNPSHLPPIPSSKLVNPVTLPPGLAKLSTKPLPTGSAIIGDTIG